MTTAISAPMRSQALPSTQPKRARDLSTEHENSSGYELSADHFLSFIERTSSQAGAAPAIDTHTCRMRVACETAIGRRDIDVDVHLQTETANLTGPVEHAIAQVAPATTFISAKSGDNVWSGTGVLIRPEQLDPAIVASLNLKATDRIVLTNHHVATHNNAAAEQLRITLPGTNDIDADPSNDSRHYRAEIVRSPINGAPLMDAALDIAALIIRTSDQLPTVTLGDANYNAELKLGQTVISMGFPAALPRISATVGHISQARQVTNIEPAEVLHHTATINGGNSGGPLITLDGVMIAMNTYTLRRRDDMNFSEHLPEQLAILRKIFHTGEMTRGELGIRFDAFHPFDHLLFPEKNGALVSSVVANSMASSELQEGDVITAMEDMTTQEITRPNMWNKKLTALLDRWIHERVPGRNVKVTYYRQTEVMGVTMWAKHETLLPVGKLVDEG